MPEGVDREVFLKLETDAAFLEVVKREVKEWLKNTYSSMWVNEFTRG